MPYLVVGRAPRGKDYFGNERFIKNLRAKMVKFLNDDSCEIRLAAVIDLAIFYANSAISELPLVTETILKKVCFTNTNQSKQVAGSFLRYTFKFNDVNTINGAIGIIKVHLKDGESLCAPHMVALNYLDSDRDPAILERQHPEMREAVELLLGERDEQ